MIQPILKIQNLTISFKSYINLLEINIEKKVNNVSLEFFEGEVVSIIGASGSGKSLLAHSLLGILPKNAIVEGQILYRNTPLEQTKFNNIRGNEISLVPQSLSALDPYLNIGQQLRVSVLDGNSEYKVKRMLGMLGLDSNILSLYPHEISGGMARKVLVAMSLINDASIILADEPTPGMDVEALNLTLGYLLDLKDKKKTIIVISHDIESAIKISDRVIVFKSGEVVEIINSKNLKKIDQAVIECNYTKKLLRALPVNLTKNSLIRKSKNHEVRSQ